MGGDRAGKKTCITRVFWRGKPKVGTSLFWTCHPHILTVSSFPPFYPTPEGGGSRKGVSNLWTISLIGRLFRGGGKKVFRGRKRGGPTKVNFYFLRRERGGCVVVRMQKERGIYGNSLFLKGKQKSKKEKDGDNQHKSMGFFVQKTANVLFVARKKQKQKQGYFLFFSVFSISLLFCESVCRQSLRRFAAVPTTTTTVRDIFRFTYIFPLSLFKSTRKRVLFIVVIMCLSLILKKEGDMRATVRKGTKKADWLKWRKEAFSRTWKKVSLLFFFIIYWKPNWIFRLFFSVVPIISGPDVLESPPPFFETWLSSAAVFTYSKLENKESFFFSSPPRRSRVLQFPIKLLCDCSPILAAPPYFKFRGICSYFLSSGEIWLDRGRKYNKLWKKYFFSENIYSSTFPNFSP